MTIDRTDFSLENKLMIYDGNCYLCRSGAYLSKQFGRLTEANMSTYDDLKEDLRLEIDFSRFRNEMALIDVKTRTVKYGLEGVLYVMATRFRVFGHIKVNSLLFNILNFFYKAIAYNRYILFPNDGIKLCSCSPPLQKQSRISFIILMVIPSILILFLANDVSIKFAGAENQHLLNSSITCWTFLLLLQAMCCFVFLKNDERYDYLGNLSVIMICGSVFFIPFVILTSLLEDFYIVPYIFIFLYSIYTMARMQAKRKMLPQIGRTWTLMLFMLTPIFSIIILNLLRIEKWLS